MKSLVVLSIVMMLAGCASGQLDLYDAEGDKVGECTAGYDWHPYGVEHSVDWLLNWCAQTAIEQGVQVASVSDPSILQKDYAYPQPESADYWTKQSAKKAFKAGLISEKQYGYILADIENQFFFRNRDALRKLESGEISKAEYDRLLRDSERIFKGN